MLLQHLKELAGGIVGKNTFEGYPLRVEYFLTQRGQKLLEAVAILQSVGIEIMLEEHREDFLIERGLLKEQKSG